MAYGNSVLPSLTGKVQDFGDRPIYWEFYENNGWRAARFGDWKAIQHDMHMEEHRPIELYNLKNDIRETSNVATEHPEIISKAKEIFEESHIRSDNFVWNYLK